ncbi:putative DNA primase/helicase [Lipingzhangella halophila]|uniref:Putative DNA primase/helicase n=1 Tax=Lipingzhangella halophila TaxID=1783352 RepID=A0A7W7RBW8_9ACTN|nr:DNA primase family protein [Lipingzhangella halophila]MBB4929185.1 putative DNA primase/helicase [Lipingzhangella halophila]MBB4934719.1 putative DNA primase/helicase [Lipingzhangella halophila]
MTLESDEVPAPSNPMAVARHLAPDWKDEHGRLLRRRWRGSWMYWDRTCWREMDEQQVRAELYCRLEHATYTGVNPKGEPEVREWAPTRTKLANLLDALGALMLVPTEVDPPAWLDTPDGEQEWSPIVACQNGLLRIRDRALLPLDPGFFNLVSVPYSYDPHASAPTWERFLHQLWPEDPESIAALQEWFGYVLSGRTDQQKILLAVGPTRSGKGTLARVLADLVGRSNMAGPTLAGLATNFGLSTLVGKPLAVISDARLSGRDNSQVVERLLTISGEDTIDIDRKYRQPWTGKLSTRLMVLSNELPNFGDSSGVIARRFIVLTMTTSWLGKEDTALTGKLAAEMPGILNWALDGLARLEQTGRITQPESSREAVTTMQDTASPVSAFVRECCQTGPNCQASVDEVWNAWRQWAEDSGIPTGTKQMLGRNLQSVLPQLRRGKPRADDGQRVVVYIGITLAKVAPQSSGSRTIEDHPR